MLIINQSKVYSRQDLCDISPTAYKYSVVMPPIDYKEQLHAQLQGIEA